MDGVERLHNVFKTGSGCDVNYDVSCFVDPSRPFSTCLQTPASRFLDASYPGSNDFGLMSATGSFYCHPSAFSGSLSRWPQFSSTPYMAPAYVSNCRKDECFPSYLSVTSRSAPTSRGIFNPYPHLTGSGINQFYVNDDERNDAGSGFRSTGLRDPSQLCPSPASTRLSADMDSGENGG